MFSLCKSGFKKIQKALSKTRFVLGDKVRAIFSKPLDEKTLEELEQTLFEADLGSTLTCEFVEHIRSYARKKTGEKNFIQAIKQHAIEILHSTPHVQDKHSTTRPKVILIVGVNGSGKTTSAAKLANIYKNRGQRVLLAAGDTFRAAAIEQLQTWSDRLHIDCIKGKQGGDPSATIFDALSAAIARHHDVVIVDTAGRLQSKTDLMQELSKIIRVIKKLIPTAPHELYLVLDATTGQNAIDQAKTFHTFTPLTGLIVTKLDGSAKGGIILPIYHLLGIPVHYIGVGEKVEDFIPFDSNSYIDALFT